MSGFKNLLANYTHLARYVTTDSLCINTNELNMVIKGFDIPYDQNVEYGAIYTSPGLYSRPYILMGLSSPSHITVRLLINPVNAIILFYYVLNNTLWRGFDLTLVYHWTKSTFNVSTKAHTTEPHGDVPGSITNPLTTSSVTYDENTLRISLNNECGDYYDSEGNKLELTPVLYRNIYAKNLDTDEYYFNLIPVYDPYTGMCGFKDTVNNQYYIDRTKSWEYLFNYYPETTE